jgi:hypothetical protein
VTAADDLIDETARLGIGLRAESGDLEVLWDGRYDPEVRRRLVAAKAVIVPALAREPQGPGDPRWVHRLLCDPASAARWRDLVDLLRGGRSAEPPSNAIGFLAWRKLSGDAK